MQINCVTSVITTLGPGGHHVNKNIPLPFHYRRIYSEKLISGHRSVIDMAYIGLYLQVLQSQMFVVKYR